MTIISNIKNVSGKIGNITKKSFGPLAPLEQFDYTAGANFRYPLDVGDPNLYPHTVEFQCWLPVPTGMADIQSNARNDYPQPTNSKGRVAESLRGVPVRIPPNERTMKINDNLGKNRRITDFTRRAEISDLIALYLPQGAWNDRINNDYNTKSVTDAMGVAGYLLEAGSGFLDTWKKQGGWEAIKGLAAPGTELVTGTAATYLGGDAQASKEIALSALGYAINPQFEVVYNATQMREFQFDFTMTPRNKDEAESCIKIIRRLKFHASPEYTGTGTGRYVIPPSYFDIEFKYLGERNKHLPVISTCVLNTVDVNYSGGLEQWASYVDGMPIQIQMVLNFMELEVMHKSLRAEGY